MAKNIRRIETGFVAFCTFVLCTGTAWGWISSKPTFNYNASYPQYSTIEDTEIHNCGISIELVDGALWFYDVSDGNATIVGGPGYGAVVIPSTIGPYPVTAIMEGAFSNREGLTSVTIPDSMTSIEEHVFENCTGLTSVTIPDSMKSIGDRAFGNCTGLTAVYIHDLAAWYGIAFGDNPLKYAKHLYLDGKELAGDLVIPDGTTSIGDYAFYYCTNLTSVAIPNSVTNIGWGAFYGCSGMQSFSVASGNPVYQSGTGLLLTKDGKQLLYGVNGDVVIPDGVTMIGSYAFYNCPGLTSVTIPNSVTFIADTAFDGCSGLQFFSVASANPDYQAEAGLLLRTYP